MLVYFQFRRCGYYAKGLIEADNLEVSMERLSGLSMLSTFKWESQLNYIPERRQFTNYRGV